MHEKQSPFWRFRSILVEFQVFGKKGSQRLDFKTVQRQQLSIVSNRKQDGKYIWAFFNAADS